MTPTFCGYHQHFTDGACIAGKRSINRNDLTVRISDIDAMLGDDETAASNGYLVNLALKAEQAQLTVLRDAISIFGTRADVDGGR